MLTKERRPAIRTLRGWALAVLQEAGVIHARERAFDIARQDPPSGVSWEEAAIELDEVLGRSATLPRMSAATLNAQVAAKEAFAAPQRVWFQNL